MSFKKILFSCALTFAASASGLNVDYISKDIITLRKQGNNRFVELANSRVEKTKMNVQITHQDGAVEKYNVAIGQSEKRKNKELLELRLNKAQALVGLKRHQLHKAFVENGRVRIPVEVAKNVMAPSIKNDLKHLLKNLDRNINSSDIKTHIKTVKIDCKRRSSLTLKCTTLSKISASVDSAKKSEVQQLIGHLSDLKKEMASDLSVKYDMDGYREFLNKSERLIKDSLKTIKSKNIVTTLLDTKQLIIDERLESYEYTAIRAQSIVKFVDRILVKLSKAS
ncbi:hypothetical protein [Bacteriovorax sp. DB6_IX]|uniref:hypothetical protein n=1 Tax=Bacteriovorax sp. DB6_IX TaxID=1353530 RepID=UPI00038A0705|nr:hypothetical protein [Bacteriovorax sp. DB6_IX]EQC52324.1 hypothetical protein M901_2518 [Bacteriovorax sp. DB6_IX]